MRLSNKSDNTMIAKQPAKFRLVGPGVVLYGVKCAHCGGHLIAPKAGPLPVNCSPRCKQADYRRRRRLGQPTREEQRKTTS